MVVELFAELEEVGCGSTRACGLRILAGVVAESVRMAERLIRHRVGLGGIVEEVGVDMPGNHTVEDLQVVWNT